MRTLKMVITTLPLLLVMSCILYAEPVTWTSGEYEIRSGTPWSTILELQTYNNVTVRMYDGGVNQFSMYDNSNLSMYGPGSVDSLNLYENATAFLYGGWIMSELYIDPASTGVVKLYAEFDRFEPYGPNGKGHLYGNWISDESPFSVYLSSDGAYSKVQFIPEPASLLLLGLGAIAISRKRTRKAK